MADTPEARAAKKRSEIDFHACEANCNTCSHLQRVVRPKNRAFLLYGQCTNPNTQKHLSPYASRFEGDVMVFHPDDHMGMPCYVSRWA
jgi:hypothetical protein